MDKIIGTINNNLRSVINGIRQHLEESESYLNKVNSDMDKKVALAQDYKEQVSEAKNRINAIEDEIDALEKDLNDLNAKFGGTDFKEILSAGNKEINTKIIEKRAVIQKESQMILNLTEEARKIKEELIVLREKKDKLESDIKNTAIVERYYSTKVNEIIDYVEAGNDLNEYTVTAPQTELLVDNDREEQLIEVSTALNDHVFEEIDEITSSEPDATLVEEAMKTVNVTFVPREIENKDENPEDKIGDRKLFVKQLSGCSEVMLQMVIAAMEEKGMSEEFIDGILKEAGRNVVDEEVAVEETSDVKELEIEEEKTPEVEEEKVEDGIATKPFQSIVTEDLTKKPIVEETSMEEEKEEIDPNDLTQEIDLGETIQKEEVEEEKTTKPGRLENPLSMDEIIKETIEEEKYPLFDDSSIDLNMLEDDIEDDGEESSTAPIADTKEDVQAVEENEPEDEEDDGSFVNPMYEEEKDPSIIEIEIEDDLELNKNLFNEKAAISGEDITSLGIDASKLKSSDIDILMNKLDRVRLEKRINILNKHNIPVESTYSNINVLVEVSAENLDAMLTMLENVSKEDLSSIISILDKVNINRLEQSIEVNKDKELLDILIPAIDEVDNTIKDKLDMTDDEYLTLTTSVSEEIVKKINLLSDRVVENYNYLNTLGINNIRECLTKYPSKLLLDTKEFKDILDKYDLDDLVRCINKNAKVFDKI